MNIRQQHAARSRRVKVISASALALIFGIGAAHAQTNNDARKTEAEKQKDKELLTPVRPLPRKVGDSNWPSANPEAQRAADEKKAQAANPAPAQNNTQPQQNARPQQQPAAAQTASPPQQQPATGARGTPAQQQPAQSAQGNRQPQQQPATAQPAQGTGQSAQRSFASIRLGTDAAGKVAINDDQERQLANALRRQRLQPADITAQVGGPPPQNVRLAAVTADMVDVLPQFRGYSYFATANEVYIVDPSANRVVAFLPVKPAAVASRPPATPGTTGSAPAAGTTASVPAEPAMRGARTTRRAADLAGIEAAVEREMTRRGMSPRGSGSATTRTIVVEDPPVTVYRVPRPWYFGGRGAIEIDDD